MNRASNPCRQLLCTAAIGAFAVVSTHGAKAQERDKQPRIAFADILTIQTDGAMDEGTPSGPEQIGAVALRGNEAIADARFQEVVERYFGEPLTEEVLQQLTDELAQLAREEGYPYARTSIDEEAAARGFVAIEIDEGRIDAVTIEGAVNAQAQRMLDSLVGKPVSQSDLESVVLRASDIPGVILRGASIKRDGDLNTLVVRLDKRDAEARLAADNYGTESFGPIRLNASSRFTRVFASSDEIRTSLRLNPIEPEELLFVSGSYQTQVTRGGTTIRIAGAVGETAPGGLVDGSDISGDTARVSLAVTTPLKRSKDTSVWLESEAAYISIDQDDLGTMLRDDTLVSAAIGLRTRFSTAGGGFVRTGVYVERGLGILGATRVGDLNASRGDGDGVYTKFRADADARIPIMKRVDAYLAVAGQIADRPLLASEELSLGGAYRVRGYDFAEVLGDDGAYGLAELRYRMNTKDLPLDFLQLYSFIDGGYVNDIDASGSEGSLFSAGPGVRGRLGIFDFEVEGAFPLGGSGEHSDADPQVNVRAGVSF